MKQIDILYMVEDLNDELCNLSPELYDDGSCYNFVSTGWVDVVTFCDHCLYCSEVDSEEDIKNAGGFKEYLIQQRDRFIDLLVKMKGN